MLLFPSSRASATPRSRFLYICVLCAYVLLYLSISLSLSLSISLNKYIHIYIYIYPSRYLCTYITSGG